MKDRILMKARILLLENVLRHLLVNICEDIPRERGTEHLWEAVEDAEDALDNWVSEAQEE